MVVKIKKIEIIFCLYNGKEEIVVELVDMCFLLRFIFLWLLILRYVLMIYKFLRLYFIWGFLLMKIFL